MIHSRIPSFRATATRAFPQPFCTQLATIEPLQLGVAAGRMSAGFVPEKAQQRTALFGQRAEPLARSTGVFARNQTHVGRHGLAIGEALWIPRNASVAKAVTGPTPRQRLAPQGAVGALPGGVRSGGSMVTAGFHS
jgi:hypothetical protein